jgi:hypothetical protein
MNTGLLTVIAMSTFGVFENINQSNIYHVIARIYFNKTNFSLFFIKVFTKLGLTVAITIISVQKTINPLFNIPTNFE